MRDTGLAPVVDLGPFALPSVFWTPSYLGPSQGLEHLPFLFWLVQAARPAALVSVGDRSGAMYFGLCQAVLQLSLGTRCHGVLADQDSETSLRIREYHGARYGAFSTLSGDSLGARGLLEEGGVDILHIECGGDPERLQLELEKWGSRLSDRAVVVASGLACPERAASGPGAPWGRGALPSFQLTHSGGLLVIGAGRHPPELLRHLFDAGSREDTGVALRSMFACLGRACVSSFLHDSVQGKLDELSGAPRRMPAPASADHGDDGHGSIQRVASELRERGARIRRLELDGLLLRKECDDLRRAVKMLEGEIAARDSRREDMAAKCDRLRKQLQRAQDEKSVLVEAARVQSGTLTRVRKELSVARGRVKRMSQRHAQLEAELGRIMQSVSWRVTDPVRRCLHHLRRLRPWT